MSERIVSVADHYGYDQMMEDLAKLCRANPFLRLSYIGESVMGKPIPAIQIGIGAARIHYNAAFHANEWITSLIVMVFLEDYARAIQSDEYILDQRATELFNRSTLFIVPMVNPDGVDLVHYGTNTGHPYHDLLLQWNRGSADYSQWKSNIRGVDLNDQFPAHWENEKLRRSPDGPGSRDYPGDAPLSEPEAVAIAEFTKRKDYHLVIAFHTQGREIYWNYRDYEPERASWMAEQLADASGYEAVKLTDSDAGYKDWFIQEYSRPGFTIEAGYGCNPLPISQFNDIYEEVRPILVLGLSLSLEGD
ncbi:MAG: M14 family metallocarboxypeptidase [Paenibacillaceae bacterium]